MGRSIVTAVSYIHQWHLWMVGSPVSWPAVDSASSSVRTHTFWYRPVVKLAWFLGLINGLIDLHEARWIRVNLASLVLPFPLADLSRLITNPSEWVASQLLYIASLSTSCISLLKIVMPIFFPYMTNWYEYVSGLFYGKTRVEGHWVRSVDVNKLPPPPLSVIDMYYHFRVLFGDPERYGAATSRVFAIYENFPV